jgi:hypothetical protein
MGEEQTWRPATEQSWHRAKWRAARKGNHDFGKLAWLRVDLDRARVLLDHDVMADRKPKPRPFSRRSSTERCGWPEQVRP